MGSRRSKFSELEDLIQGDQGEVGLTLEYDEDSGEMYFTHMASAEKEKFTKNNNFATSFRVFSHSILSFLSNTTHI